MKIVIHPDSPRGVAESLRPVDGLDIALPATADDVARELAAGAEVFVTSFWRDDFLSPSLRWVAGTGAGTEQYPLDKFSERAIVLTTAHDVHSVCVAEHAFALLLASTRRIGPAVRNMVTRTWKPEPGDELAGKRMAIVGLGRIGEEVARRALAWDMDVVGIKRTPDDYSGCVREVRGSHALSEVCEWADIVVLTAPATPSTVGLIGDEELALLGAGWLVNVGRGALVDMHALYRALTDGALRGAALDVTDPEPLPADSPLWGCANLVLTAHYAGDSPNFGPRWLRIFEQNRRAFSGLDVWVNRVGNAG